MKKLDDVLNEMCTKHNVIYLTKNYELFGFKTGNREIDKANLEKIKQSLMQSQILESAIIVGYSPQCPEGKIFKIVEGQHRYLACKELSLPLSFVVKKDLDADNQEEFIKITQLLNTASKEWDVTNFMGSRATLNEVDYVRYQKIYKKYKLKNDGGFEHEILFYILNKIEGRKRINHKNFKYGNLVLSEEDANMLDSKLNDLTEFLPKIIDSGKRYYLKALSDIMDLEIDKCRLNERLISFGKDIPFSKEKEFSIRFLAEKVYNPNLKSKKIYLYKAGNDDILLQVK
jgi:hypothetical protein